MVQVGIDASIQFAEVAPYIVNNEGGKTRLKLLNFLQDTQKIIMLSSHTSNDSC